MQSAKQARIRKTYSTPTLRKLGPEEAKQFLNEQAKMGNQGAKEILDLALPREKDSK